MFKSAVFKLTAWYVGALVVVCVIFSIPIYSVASARLRSGAVRQTEFVRTLPDTYEEDGILSRLEKLRDKQLADDRHQLQLALIVINLSIIGFGAYASYLFARRTLKPIEQAHAAQTRFTADASHELRTPLAVMQTEIEVALRSKRLDAANAKEVLASNLEEIARLRELSDQLLGLTRADAQSLALVKTNLAKLVRDHAAALAKKHHLKIPVDTPKIVYANLDKVLFSQVLGIIIDNAVLYSGLDDPEIRVGVVLQDSEILTTISNRGTPITPKDREHIFERFYRGSNATAPNPKGHGLGLALAKDVINRHGGTISVTSSKKAGTIFTIQLPAIAPK